MGGRVLGAKLALFVGDHLVSLQRDDTPGLLWAGFWDLPGGGIETGETPLQCVLRETQEELSVRLPPDQVQWGRGYGTTSGDISWFFAAHVPATWAEEIVLGDEGQGWMLMTPSDFLAHEGVVPSFKPRLRDYLAGVETTRFEGLT